MGKHLALDLTGQAFVLDPSNKPHEEIDLQLGIPETESHVDIYKKGLHQIKAGKVLATTAKTTNGQHLYVGPPGTRKTLTLAQLVWLLVSVNRKILLTALSNGAIDKAINDVWLNRPDSLRHKKVLRLEIGSLEAMSLLTLNQDAFAEIEDVNQMSRKVIYIYIYI